MRAVVDDRGLTALNGARPDRSSMLAWALGCSLAALAGILLAPLQTLTHLPLTLLIVNAYAAALMGRLRSLPITFLGALLLGLLDSYAFTYLPEEGSIEPFVRALRPAIPALVLFVVLVALPTARLRTNAGMRRLAAPEPTWIGSLVMAACVAGAGLVMAAGLSDGDATKAGKAVALGIIALSLVPLVGWAGQLCLCQMSFAAIGAICVANMGGGSNPAAIVVGMGIAALTGVLVALPAARLSGIELALATAAFAVILDRWVFATPDVEIFGFTFSTFNRTNVTVDPLSLPFVGELTPPSLLVLLCVVFALVHLLLTAVRRSGFGIRLLALRESPAACATLGLDPAAARLAVFAFSAALAALGGALYAGTLGSISPFNFDLFQSLPLLLVTVAGGVASTGGAVFAVIVLGGMPAIAARFASPAGLIGLLPGTMGITLGRNPDGVTTDLRNRLMPVWRSPVLLGVVAAIEAGLAVAWVNSSVSGWGGLLVAFLVPFVVARVAERFGDRTVTLHPLDGIEHRRLTADDRAELDLALGLAEVPR
jgi:branched-chain amino acid transport system permease protein